MAVNDLIDVLIALGVIGVIIIIIFAKIIKNNPKVGEWLEMYNPSNLYQKVEIPKEPLEKFEQIYEDRRKMI